MSSSSGLGLSRSNHTRQKSHPPPQSTMLSKQVSAPAMNRQPSNSSDDSASSQQTARSSARPSPSPYSQRSQVPATASSTSLASSSTQPEGHISYGRPPRVHSPVGGHSDIQRHRARQHSQGFFEPTLPTTNMAQSPSLSNLSTSQIAAQAAMQVQANNPHARRRSQTIPDPQANNQPAARRIPSYNSTSSQASNSTSRPPSQTRGGQQQPGNTVANTATAAYAASAAYPKSPIPSPSLQQHDFAPPPPLPSMSSDKDLKPGKEKSRMKIFSKPKTINVTGIKDPDKKAFPSPKKPGAFNAATFPRSFNHSTTSLVDPLPSSASSIYSIPNTSTSTLTPTDSRATGDKEKHRHHFLSRQKHKLKDAAEHHNLSLSSAASNSRQTDPNMQPLYSFVPASPALSTTFNKSKTGLDLRHGGRALREKKREEKAAAGTFVPPLSTTTTITTPTETPSRDRDDPLLGTPDWQSPGTNVFGPSSSGALPDPGALQQGLGAFGLPGMTLDDAWPLLKARLLNVFEGEEIRFPIEDFNRLVMAHLQRCVQQHSPGSIVQDLRDLVATGFRSLDQTLRRVPDHRLVPQLVEMWALVFGTILPFIQAVFHPLDLEFKGRGTALSPKDAAELRRSLSTFSQTNNNRSSPSSLTIPDLLDVRTLVLMAFRDAIILPRHDNLLSIFSRLSLDNINAMPPDRLESPPPLRPGTANSFGSSGQGDLPTTSFNSQGSTLLDSSNAGSLGARSRATSNTSAMSAGSFHSISSSRPHASSHGSSTTGARTQAQQQIQATSQPQPQPQPQMDSAHVTQTAARMLQCISILAGLQSSSVAARAADNEAINGMEDGETLARKKLERLGKELKLNWLGRGRTGRNRRGLVGAKVRNPVVGVTA